MMLSVLFGIMAVFSFMLAVRNKIAANQMLKWSSVIGRINRSEAEPYDDHESAGYRPAVDYEFEVDGVTYTGSRISLFNFNSGILNFVIKQLADYKAGANVTVFFNPQNPRDCILDRKHSLFKEKRHIIFGIVFAISAILIAM